MTIAYLLVVTVPAVFCVYADAHLGRHTVKRALTYAEQNGLDCLSVVPEVRSAGLVGDAVFNVSLAIMSGGGRTSTGFVDDSSAHRRQRNG
jgi:hypothetical protein